MPQQTPESVEWIGLYGSLMRGLGAMDELGIREAIRFAGPCLLPGELFDLGRYPGMRRGSGRVTAELYAILDPGVLVVLDSFEGYEPDRPRDSLYLRERVPLIEPTGTSAWTYFYNHVPDASARVPNGDWRAHLAARE